MACCMWDNSKIIKDDMFFYIKIIPQRSVPSNSCQVQMILRKHLDESLKKNVFCLLFLLFDKRHNLKRFL